MPAEYLHGIIPKLPLSNTSITLVDGIGQFSTGGALNLFIQGRNRAGYTIPSVAIAPITYTATQAIQISFPAAARTAATDFHYYIISHSPTGNPVNAITLFHWTNYEADQLTPRVLSPVLLNRDEHVTIAPSVAIPSDLPTGADLLDGMMRLVVGGVPTSAYYRYERFTTEAPDEVKVLEPRSGEKWVRTGSPNVGIIQSVYGADGCAAPINGLSRETIILTPPYPATGGTPIKGTPIKLVYRNDSSVPIPAGTSFLLGVTLEGSPASQLFDGKLAITPRGFVNLSDGSIDTSDGVGGEMPDIGGDVEWKYSSRSILFLHKPLPSGWAYFVEVALLFTSEQLDGRVLEGMAIAINLGIAPTAGDYAYGIWKVTGDIILSDDDRLKVVPGAGLSARVLSGSALIQRFVFPNRGDRTVYGIMPNLADQKITVNGNGSLFYRGVGDVPGTEAVRSLVSCEVGLSAVGAWSDFVTVEANGGLAVTLNYPSDADGHGTVRANYPYLAGNSKGRFNPPYVQMFVRRQSDGAIYKLPTLVSVLPAFTQSTAVNSLAGATIVGSLPSRPQGDFCLFDPATVSVATASGNLDADVYQVASAYYFDGSAISSISHDPARGCLAEIPGTFEDLFQVYCSWGGAIASSLIRLIPESDTFPWQTRRVHGEKKRIYFDPESTHANDGVISWQPSWRTAAQPGRWRLEEQTAWYTVSGAPDPLLGMLGDIAIDTRSASPTLGNLWRKTDVSTWTPSGNIRGAQGAKGVNFRGAWDSSADYVVDDVVFYEGSSWRSLAANTNFVPIEGTTWTLFAQRGQFGAAGAQGVAGERGARGITPRGAWDNATIYVVDDVVFFDGSSWRAIAASTNVVPVEGASWTLFAARGAAGADGATGSTGAQGTPGAGINPRGAWVSAATYYTADVVFYQGSSWRAIAPSTSVAPVEGTSWTLFAAKGDTGAAGSVNAASAVRLQTQATDPTTATGEIALYNKNGGVYQRLESDGVVSQVGSGGSGVSLDEIWLLGN